MEFRVLGPLVVSGDDGEIPIGAAKQRALLTLLLLRRGELVPTATLVDELWDERPPATAVKTVQVYVAELRKLLGRELIETRPGGYLLHADPDAIDAVRFEELVAQGRDRLAAGDGAGAGARLGEALALWRGPPLAEFQYETFARDETRRLEELRLVAQELLLEIELALGGHAEAVPELEALIREHPLRENLRRLLMLALYRSGRQADALTAYRDARTTLLDELGLDPGEPLQRLETQILRHDPALAPAVPPPSTLYRSNLPAQATTFIGRARELRELSRLLDGGTRLLTLTGPGGTGKTRLALEAAAEAAHRFPGGTWWVPLASVRDPRLVAAAVAQALEVPEQPGREPEESLREALKAPGSLILLDNVEHLLPEAAEVVALLHEGNGPSIVVTTRERLRLVGEHTYPVAPLEEADSVELFTSRAAAAGSIVDDAPAVAALCAQLDHLPLAIELAAARIGLFDPGEMLERLGGRLDPLKGARNAAPRQRTLRAAIDWSYELLEPEQRELFAALGVFSGGCTLDAVEEICGGDLDTLGALLDKSLIRRTGGRIWMLETIREYASEQLEAGGGADLVRGRHLEHFVTLAAEAAPGRARHNQRETLALLDVEIGNLRAALAWAEHIGAVEAGAHLVTGLAWFWEARGRWSEAAQWLRSFSDSSAALGAADRARTLFWLGRLLLWQSDWHTADARLAEAEALGREAGLEAVVALALGKRAWIAGETGEFALNRDLIEEAEITARRLADDWVLAEVLNDQGAIRHYAGDYAGAKMSFRESLALRRRLGDRLNVIDSLNNIANVAMFEGRYGEAAEGFEGCLELSRDLGDMRLRVLAGVNRGQVHLLAGEPAEARRVLEENAELCVSCGDRRIGAAALQALAAVHASGEPADAARLWGAGRSVHGHATNADEQLLWESFVSQAEQKLGREDFAATAEEGRAMSFEQAVAYALALPPHSSVTAVTIPPRPPPHSGPSWPQKDDSQRPNMN